MTPVGTQLFLVSTGLGLVGAPYPRERMVFFAILGGCIGLFTGVPGAVLLAAATLSAHARACEKDKNDAAAQAFGYGPAAYHVPYSRG
jgi:hypothetical protein